MLTTTIFLPSVLFQVNNIEFIFNLLYISNYNYIFYKFLELAPEALFLSIIILKLITLLFNRINHELNQWYWSLFGISVVYIVKFLLLGCCYNAVFFIFDFSMLNTFFITSSKFIILFFFISYIALIKTNLRLAKKKLIVELPWLLALATYFIFILLSSFDLFISYLSIEGLSFILYILASSINNSFISKEAAFKYLAVGSISSGFLLIGLSWIYSILGSLNFNKLQYYLLLSQNSEIIEIQLKLAIFLVLFAFLFKLGAFPCYIWVSDVYTGIWTPITFYFATVVKLGLALFLTRFLYTTCFGLSYFWSKLFLISGVGSILIGALGALFQTELKRFIAYASINQIGFFLLSLTSRTVFGLKAGLLYLMIYIIMNIIFFGILLNGFNFITGRNLRYFTDLNGIVDNYPIIALFLVIVLFSMAGIPPLAGFFTKMYIFCAIVSTQIINYNLIYLLVLTIISSFYYINIVRQVFFEVPQTWNIFFIHNNFNINFFLGFLVLVISGWLLLFNNLSYIFEMFSLNCAAPLLLSSIVVF